jgi:GTP diphosphokinase / guanosine-3',5'-bis(diphosphate) 3'-diphosphatase
MHVPLNQTNLAEIMAHFKKPSATELNYGIAVGNVDLRELREFSVVGDKLTAPVREPSRTEQKAEPDDEQDNAATKVAVPKGTEILIFGDQSDKVLYKLSQCCQPIPGDNVFGFKASDGIRIHRTDCPNAARLLANYGHKIIKAKWAKNKEISFLTGVRIFGLDDVGVIQKITNVISGDLRMNMRSLSIDSQDGLFQGNIMVYVHDREELNNLCAKLGELEGIHSIERLESGSEGV